MIGQCPRCNAPLLFVGIDIRPECSQCDASLVLDHDGTILDLDEVKDRVQNTWVKKPEGNDVRLRFTKAQMRERILNDPDVEELAGPLVKEKSKVSGYEKRTVYEFEVADETWEVESWDFDHIEISETRKNGQEDTHCYVELVLKDGKWVMLKHSREHLEQYRCSETADEIVRFIQENGLPE